MKLKANGIRMNYERVGQGRDFVLVHGAGDSLKAWFNQVPILSRYYRVLTYDVRGHGKTECPPGELNRNVWVEDLHALLGALGIKKTILLGYSMGGGIALQFACQHPELIDALILSNSGAVAAAPPSEEALRQRMAQRQAMIDGLKRRGMPAVYETWGNLFSPGFLDHHPEVGRKHKRLVLQNDPKSFLRVMEGMAAPTPPPEVSRLHCPVLIIAGAHDTFSGPEAAIASQKAIPGSWAQVFPTGHNAPMERPRAYNEAVLAFLRSVGLG
ncbi:MAG: alpha/beta hydrolase [Chloroflexi bacterium]|nr:alpha/beta hydrolase [Chloroflexota bacterium]